jgi:hypothetical protein
MTGRATAVRPGRHRSRARRAAVAVCASVITFASLAGSALANAPNPISGTTKLDQVTTNSNGTVTVTIEGQWNFVTQTDCPTARNGVGYQVDWFDGNTDNAIGGANSPDGVLYVGGPIFPGGPNDKIVHSVETLGGSSAFGNAFYDGVPASYIAHDATNPTPNTTDAQNWFSNCANEDPTTKISSGTWGPISHTYPAGTTSITVCPVMYDPHGGSDDSGKSSLKDITAGGTGHNADNSYEGNGTGTNGNNCLKASFTIPPPGTPPSTPPTTTTTTPSSTAPGFKVVKEQKIGNGTFTTNTLTGSVGQTVQYEIIVTNTGNTALTFTHFSDPHCQTIEGGPGTTAVQPGDSTVFTCDHVLTKADLKRGSHSNVATVTGTPPGGAPISGASNKVVVKVKAHVKAKKISRKPKKPTGFTG